MGAVFATGHYIGVLILEVGIVGGVVLLEPSELSILEWWVLVLSRWVNCLRLDKRTMHTCNRELSVLERCPAGDVPLYNNYQLHFQNLIQ